MDFARLRLSGFKSFVEPAEFRIETGLTGVVGPNGCGKSNLLEALRWVMGAASARAMRGEGMDDVIFAGSGARPARNHAEVTLTIDNAGRDAPAPFRNEPVLEVSRRIDRGEGSIFRVNGREVRARDVQILFADASTGANSPALVRQGQISELIAARPQNRRRILEEAAGVTGLHGRRHEAELRVAAAAANLDRLDDLARELDSGLARLRREARQASRYKALAGEIRALQGSMVKARWLEARAALSSVAANADQAHASLAEAVRAAAIAATSALAAEAGVKPLRDADAAASVLLGRLAIDKDRLDRDLDLARAEVVRLNADLERLAEDGARETAWLADADAAVLRLETDAHSLEQLIAEAPEHAPALQAEAAAAERLRADAEAEVERLAAALAVSEADARAADTRLNEARAALAGACQALHAARSEQGSLRSSPHEELDEATQTAARAAHALAAARAELSLAEAGRGEAHAGETLARMKRRSAEDALAGAAAEARALRQLTAGATGPAWPAALDQVTARAGYEAALAAALGDELDAALDPLAPAFWAGANAPSPTWPQGARPLADLVQAPPQLAVRLAYAALVEAKDGAKLQADAAPGTRLVSREGDLWRWDGYTARADAQRPAQVRLEHKTRLTALETSLAELTPAAETAKAAHAAASEVVDAAEGRLRAARAAQLSAEAGLERARQDLDERKQQAATREARAGQLEDAVRRLGDQTADAESLVTTREKELAERQVDAGAAGRLDEARRAAAQAREAASHARVTAEAEVRDRNARAARLASLAAERADWSARAMGARRRLADLDLARERASALLAGAREAPAKAEERRQTLLDALAGAEAAKAAAADALARAETIRGETDRAARAADARSADAREARATLDARRDAAQERLDEQARALAETTGVPRQQLEPTFAEAAGSDLQPGAAEARLASLERERDAMGPVNLRAEEEAGEQAGRVAELAAERADLSSALGKLRQGIGELNAEGRVRLLAAFEVIHGHFRDLFVTLFQGGQAELRLVESDDPLEAGLEILACPPGKRMAVMSLMSGGEQALTAMALIFAVFLANPAPVCVLDEADAPLDDANVERFCSLLSAMRERASTRFIVISHNALTMSRMDRLYGVTMREAGVSQLVSVDLLQAEAMVVH